MYAGCAGKTARALENACHTWAVSTFEVWSRQGAIQIHVYPYIIMEWTIPAFAFPAEAEASHFYLFTYLPYLCVTGWRREVVIRGVQDFGSASRKCDIYYYTPENRKLVCDSLILDLTCAVRWSRFAIFIKLHLTLLRFMTLLFSVICMYT